MNIKTRLTLLRDDTFLNNTSHLTNKELASMVGLSPLSLSRYRKDIHHAVDGANGAARGNVGEKLASRLLTTQGISNELMKWNHPFDILALGKVRIDVKIANKPITASTKNYVSPVWNFLVRQNKRNDADLYFLLIVPTVDVFIIPSKEIPKEARAIRFCWPTARPKLSKWQNYLDAYDLIFEFANE